MNGTLLSLGETTAVVLKCTKPEDQEISRWNKFKFGQNGGLSIPAHILCIYALHVRTRDTWKDVNQGESMLGLNSLIVRGLV